MTRVAAVQMTSGDDLAANLAQAASLLAEAAASGAQLVVLPETFALFGGRAQREQGRRERTAEGPIRQFLADQARRHRMWLVGGTVPVGGAGERVRARCLLLDPQGRECAHYDKLHLFDVAVDDAQGGYRESATYEPGSAAVVADSPLGPLGLTVCYDLRFPELYRHLAGRGAGVFAVPSAFTAVTGRAHWALLCRARAVENLAFVIGAAQGGQHSAKRATWGHSLIVNPWGEVIAELDHDRPGVLLADIDLAEVSRRRRAMPVLRHRRLAIEPPRDDGL